MNLLSNRKYTFENYGGTYQLHIASMSDLGALGELDEPFWIATSAPTHQLRCDKQALDYIDRDQNGRILSDDIRAADKWLRTVLKSFDAIDEKRLELDPAHLSKNSPEGTRMLRTARRILKNVGHAEADTLPLSVVQNQKAILQRGDSNGDGIIPPGSIADEGIAGLITDIMNTVGSVEDLSGAKGVDKAHLDRFIASADGFVKWQHMHKKEDMQPLSSGTVEAYNLLQSLRPVIEDFFQLCRVVQLNDVLSRETPPGKVPEAVFEPGACAAEYLKNSPIAKPNAAGTLPLQEGLNPQYHSEIRKFFDTVVTPLPQLDLDSNLEMMTEAEWRRIDAAFAPYRTWLAAKTGGEVEKLSLEKLEAYLQSDLPQRLQKCFDDDLAVADELAAVKDLEKVILLQRWFLPVCNNFISFPHLYNPKTRAMFEIGELVIDGRIFALNIRVTDPKAHAKVAKASGIYLMYSEITGKDAKDKFYIVTPVTSRRLGHLGVNKRGVLFDLDGRQWDARVIQVVENPVSLFEALMAPFQKIGKMLAGTVQKISSSAEKQIQTKLTSTGTEMEKGVTTGIASAATAPPAPVAAAPVAAAPPSGSAGRDMLMTGGVTIAALGSSFAFIAKTIADLDWYKALAVVAVALGIILIPVIIVAMYRLYRRNLSGILEGSGWAINGRMRLTYRLSKIFAPTPVRPHGFSIARTDVLKGLVASAKKHTRLSGDQDES